MRPDPRCGGVTVVVPALNEERVIGTCLQALAALDFPKDSFEVVVVDNGSTDRTVEIARSFSPALELTVLSAPGKTISAMRNAAAARGKGAVLAFLDADCVAPPHWLATAVAGLGRPGVGVYGAHYKVPEDATWVGRAWYGGLETALQGAIAWVPAGDLIVSRAVFEELGGFDEALATNEDCDLCERARAAGLSVVGDAEAAVVHLGTPRTLGRFYRKIRWHATDGLRVFLRSLPKVTNPRPLLYSLYTAACAAAVVAAAAYALATGALLPLGAAAAALLVPAILLSLQAAAWRRRWGAVPALTVLHVAFGLARAHALLRAAGRDSE